MSNPYKQLNAALEELLSEKEHSITLPPPNSEPLFLLLTSKPDLIGFAQLNGEGNKGIGRALENFKSLYVLNSDRWANYDLTLVFCKTGHSTATDSLWTETELDPYFCRKFVINLEDLHTDLGRLPFIPLRPENVVGFQRPPGAQTLMIDYGVSPWLAEALAVPYRLGEKRIIEECLQDPTGVPALVTRRMGAIKPPVHAEPGTRLKQLQVSNFRAYKKTTTFDLDANVVVLFGPNGLGKTSFFDAIDFICTGSVMRFDDRFPRKPARLLKSLRHLDASSQYGFVSAQFLMNGKTSDIKRTLHDRTSAEVDISTLNRTEVLANITNCSIETSDMRVENLVRLFRATHLFGQEYQSLTAGLRNNSKLPEDTVSRMLAFQDYVEAISKSERVMRELTQLMAEAQLRINSFSDSLTSKESELNSTTQLRSEMASPESLATSGMALLKRVARILDVYIDPQTSVDKEEVKSWRGLLEGRIGWLEGSIADLKAVREKLPRMSEDRSFLAEADLMVGRTGKSFSDVERRCAEKKKHLDGIKTSLDSDLRSEKTTNSRREALEWLLTNRKEYDRLKNEITRAEGDVASYRRQLLQLTETIGACRVDGNNEQSTISSLQQQLVKLEEESSFITKLLGKVEDWISKQDRLRLLNSSATQLQSSLKGADENLRKQSEDLNNAERIEKELERTLVTARQSQTDLERILEDALNQVVDQHCPVCGVEHHSKAILESQIRQRIGVISPSLQAAINSSEAAKAETERLRREQTRFESQIQILQNEISSTARRIETLTSEQQFYEQQIRTLELIPDNRTLAAELDKKKYKVDQEIEKTRAEITERTSRLETNRERLSSLIDQESSLQSKIDASIALGQRFSAMVNDIETEAIRRQVSLKENASAVENEIARLAVISKELQEKIQTRKDLVIQDEGEYGAVLNERSKIQQQIDDLKRRVHELTRSISGFESELTRLGLDTAVSIEEVGVTILRNEALLSDGEVAKGELLRFELALDEVQLSARLSQLKQEIDDLSSALSKAETEYAHLNDWHAYFARLKEELESVRRRSLKNYIEKYGPLTSSIQKRLRSVYGFGDLKLQQEKSGIALRVERKGHKDLPPSDYFSEAQLQIVTLSMFLSAVLTQTWSSFAPILLDDPVTHFDDLNAYSFLDVIRGLIDEPGKGPQFILSTCEERLYRLMRQKFAQLNGQAIFYEFSSIGEDGPKVERHSN